MDCSKLIKIFLKNLLNFFSFLNLLQGRYLIIKKYSFYSTLLSQSVLKLNRLKISTFAAKLILMTSNAIFNLESLKFKTKRD